MPADESGRQMGQVLLRQTIGCEVEGGIASRRRAERVKMRGEMPVGADCVREVDRADKLTCIHLDRRADRAIRRWAPVREESARWRIDRFGILTIAVVQFQNIAGIRAGKIMPIIHARDYSTRGKGRTEGDGQNAVPSNKAERKSGRYPFRPPALSSLLNLG
jgi:hypothetical protein